MERRINHFFSVIIGITRKSERSKEKLRELNFTKILEPYLAPGQDVFRFEAIAVVAEIANEEECKQILRANREAIKFVVSILQCSLKADQHLYGIGLGVQWYAHAIGKGEA